MGLGFGVRGAPNRLKCSGVFLVFDYFRFGELVKNAKKKFRNFGDVTVGGRIVGSTSGLAFPVRGNLNRSTCSGVSLVSAYFRFGDLLKMVKKKNLGAMVCHN